MEACKRRSEKKRITTKYVLGIARFYFSKKLSQKEQLKVLTEGLLASQK